MEENSIRRYPIIGIVLVVLGVALLLQEMRVIQFSGWALVWAGLIVYGAASVIRSFIINERNKVFFGTLCFLTGILFFLKKTGLVYGTVGTYFPAFLIIFGLAFLMLFVFNVKDWHLLIPTTIFIGLGAAMMLTELGLWYSRDVWRAVASYWPILLIVVGVTMLLRRRRVRQ